MVKNPSTVQETWVLSLDQEKKEMATHFSILAWRIPWPEEPGGLQSMGLQRVRCDWATNTLTYCFFSDPVDIAKLISSSFTFSKSSLYIWSFPVPVLLEGMKDEEWECEIIGSIGLCGWREELKVKIGNFRYWYLPCVEPIYMIRLWHCFQCSKLSLILVWIKGLISTSHETEVKTLIFSYYNYTVFEHSQFEAISIREEWHFSKS